MSDAKVLETLALVEALLAGAATEGERAAAERARQRLLAKLETLESESPPVEYRFSMDNHWSRRLFLALLRNYNIRPYRYPRQRRTTVMARIPKQFVDETLWPQFTEIKARLDRHLAEITDRVIAEAFQADGADAEVIERLEAPDTPPAVEGGRDS